SGEAGRRRLESGSRTVTCAKFGGSKICQYGTVRSGRKYAAYGASLFDQPGSINYCFDLPLSAMAWRRIGFDSLVYIIGDYDRCQDPSKSRFIVETLLAQDYVVLLVIQSVNANNSVTLGQVVRLFMASLVQHVDDPEAWQNTYIITADADVWPVNQTFFDLPPGKEILHGDISGNPVPDVNQPTNAPLSYVGMKVKTWIEVMSHFGLYTMPKTPEDTISYFAAVYGKSSCEDVLRGGQGWFIDQAMISLRIEQWKRKEENGTRKIYIYQRSFKSDRIDKTRWQVTVLDGIIDAHLLQYGYKSHTWKLMRPLLILLYHNPIEVSRCDNYRLQLYKFTIIC
ncbi:hypothetical protein LSH36_347g03022, partial [Paralvinella palmiformis]